MIELFGIEVESKVSLTIQGQCYRFGANSTTHRLVTTYQQMNYYVLHSNLPETKHLRNVRHMGVP